jgi:hypothetical protein
MMKVYETQRLWAAVFLFAAFNLPLGADDQTGDATFLHNGVTAHRGNSGEFPENTIPAFASGIELGADWIELDIFRTKDGKLVVTHDRTTGRVGDRNLDVTESNYDELLRIDVYDAETLEEVARHPTPEVVHGAGGMAYHAGRFIVIGGLPEGVEVNYLYEYDESFQFQKRHVLASGYTRLGIQTATFANDRWWFGCYGNALLVTDADFNLKGRHSFNCSLGIEGLPDGRFLAASGRSDKEQGCTGRVRLAAMDDQNGLRYVE